MRADPGELRAVDARHREAVRLALRAQVHHDEPDDARALVGVRGLAADVAGGVLAGADHQDIHGVLPALGLLRGGLAGVSGALLGHRGLVFLRERSGWAAVTLTQRGTSGSR